MRSTKNPKDNRARPNDDYQRNNCSSDRWKFSKFIIAKLCKSVRKRGSFSDRQDGTIYQTASIYKQTWHIGKLKARCVLEKKCRPTDIKALQTFSPSKENAGEMQKKIPDRFPSNQDSIGIELVGETLPNGEYATVTAAQNKSLHWLIQDLTMTLRILPTEIFRHPTVSRKNPTEASTAKW